MQHLTDNDVLTLLGDADLRRDRGETDMPDYLLSLAYRIALTIGNDAIAERVAEMRNTPPNAAFSGRRPVRLNERGMSRLSASAHS